MFTFLSMAGGWASFRGRRVLDLACGTGMYTRQLKQHGEAAQVVAVLIY